MKDEITSTILYYPTIAVPSGTWLRQAVLYWDNIASIVPTDWNGVPVIKYTPEVQFLFDQQIFKPVRPESLIRDGFQKLHIFENEIKLLIETAEFKNLLPSLDQRVLGSKIHKNKVSDELFLYFHDRGLVDHDLAEERWYLFERITANVYMAMLAQHLADLEYLYTCPGTDYGLYRDLIYLTQLPNQGIVGLSTELHHVLPIPREDVSIQTILDFKQKRSQELRYFQQIIDDFQHELGKITNQEDVEYIVRKYQRSIKLEVENLQALFRDSRLATALGTVETVIKTGSLPAASALGFKLPADVTIASLGFVGLISVGKYFINQRNAHRIALRDSAFSYLYHADQAKIVNIDD